MVLDDYLMFYSWGALAYASVSPSGGLWGPFLEKAWAKSSGNYEFIEAGWAHEAIRFLTGAPTNSYYKDTVTKYSWQFSTADEAWNLISSADTKNYIMMAGVAGTSDSSWNSIGLVQNHAYTIVNAYTVKNADGSVAARLYQLRNPWGIDSKFSGKWNDDSTLW